MHRRRPGRSVEVHVEGRPSPGTSRKACVCERQRKNKGRKERSLIETNMKAQQRQHLCEQESKTASKFSRGSARSMGCVGPEPENEDTTSCQMILILRVQLLTQSVGQQPTHRGTSPIRKRPSPYEPHETLGLSLRLVIRRRVFLVSEVLNHLFLFHHELSC